MNTPESPVITCLPQKLGGSKPYGRTQVKKRRQALADGLDAAELAAALAKDKQQQEEARPAGGRLGHTRCGNPFTKESRSAAANPNLTGPVTRQVLLSEAVAHSMAAWDSEHQVQAPHSAH